MCASSRLFLVLGIFVVSCTSGWAIQVENRIINGQNSPRFPHHVFVAYENDQGGFFGGGSIISHTHVLTIAQIVRNFNNWNVGYGSENYDQLMWTRTQDAVVHPNYNLDSRENDIALLIISQPFVWSDNVKPVSLPPATTEHLPLVNEQGMILGFGWTGADARQSNSLQIGFVRVIPDERCQNIIAVSFPNHFCAQDEIQPANICQGDLGGGFLTYYRNDVVITGINSILLEGCNTNWPSAYTRIYPYLGWIKAETGL